MTFDPTSVGVTCVTLPKDDCVQVPWEYINVCGYNDQFCKLPQFRRDKTTPCFLKAIAEWTIQICHRRSCGTKQPYVIDWDNAKILGKECNTSIRKICESMWIIRRGPQAMNRDEGAHFWSNIFDPFLTGSTPSTVGVRPSGATAMFPIGFCCEQTTIAYLWMYSPQEFQRRNKPETLRNQYLFVALNCLWNRERTF